MYISASFLIFSYKFRRQIYPNCTEAKAVRRDDITRQYSIQIPQKEEIIRRRVLVQLLGKICSERFDFSSDSRSAVARCYVVVYPRRYIESTKSYRIRSLVVDRLLPIRAVKRLEGRARGVGTELRAVDRAVAAIR